MSPAAYGGRQGLMLIDKPGNITSHDVVARLRRFSGQKKIGHTGTLDPMATGLMVILLGTATRLAPYLSLMNKTYLARLELGLVTDTDDAEGRVLSRSEGPWPPAEEVRRAVKAQEGEIEQTPPDFSAVKIAARRAYQAARAGERPNLAPRRVSAFSLELLRYEPPEMELFASVSSGYYMRSLARDLGRSLGLGGGALTALRRREVGPWSLTQALTLEEVAAWNEDQWRTSLKPPAEALPHWPEIILPDAGTALSFSQGRLVNVAAASGQYKIKDIQGRFIGLGQIEAASSGGENAPRGPFLRPLRVFPVF